ncbi:MAG: radical SAM protein [Elusimicrobiales bacterium]|nr:radical SAM protein [Elusimicrobiales bacterium]
MNMQSDKPVFEKERYKKIVLFTGYACSNNCRFCMNADKRGFEPRTTEELLREIYLAKKEGADILEMIGGESAMRRDFRLLLKTAKKIGISETIIATNGRVFADKDYAKELLDSGLDSIIFSLHGAKAETHDWLTQTPGSHDLLMKAIENVRSLGLNRIYGNTTVVKQNCMELPDIARMYAAWGFTNVEFIFVDPTCGGAHNNFRLLVPKISDCAPYMRQALDIGNSAGFTQWKARYVPLCHFKGHLSHISEINEKKLYHSEHWAQDFYDGDSVANRAGISRIKPQKCSSCTLYSDCEGIWREYIRHYGDEELSPVEKQDFQ